MTDQKYKEDLSEIRNLMDRSTRFISLSGLSGILAGIYALGGAAMAYLKIQAFNRGEYSLYGEGDPLALERDLTFDLLFIAGGVVILAFVTAVLLSVKKARTNGENLWNPTSRRLLINFAIPLATGGIFCLVLLQYGFAALIAPSTLIFYGLACLNAGKYTLGDVRYLGIANIIIGLIATQFIGYGLYFWALGFGVFHIFYGSLMYFKYDKTSWLGLIDDINRAFDHRIRLGIMSVLMVNDYMEFTDLRELLDVTDGNLASHIKALEKEDYIKVEKQFINRKPNTRYRATREGKAAFQKHIDALEKLLGS